MNTSTKIQILFVCSALVVFPSCFLRKSTPSSEGSPLPAGELMSDHLFIEFAIYYLPEPSQDPEATLNRLLETEFQQVGRVEKVSESPAGMTVSARLITDVQESYAPPGLESLQYFGRGLSRDQSAALQDSTTALILVFGHPKEHVWDGLRAACELTSKLARETNGLPWDEQTREVFTPDAWEEKRLNEWTKEVPNVSKHTVIHAYNNGEYVRAITLGMAKFGLPDIVIEDVSWSLNRTTGHVINLFAQALAEGALIEEAGQFDLDIRAIKNAKVREPQLASLKSNATSVALLSLREGTREEGDPDNQLVQITFDRYTGNDVHAKQVQMMSSLFGLEDSISYIKHDEEILAASERAKAKLPSLRADFKAGLRPGEFIQVKAPFKTPDGGQEWMWVEVTSWKGDEIRGLLKNDPFNIPELQAGQTVVVSEQEVFDYIRRLPDGSEEGNETGKLIEQLGGE